MSTNLPLLQPRLIVGLQPNIKGNAQFVTDEDIIYPVGSVLAVHNHMQKRQKYIKLADKGKNVTAIVLSPTRNLLVIVESGPKPLLTVYCPNTFKKKKQISIPSDKDCYSKKYVTVTFTFDSKNLVCVTGEPDWEMYVFKISRGKLESFTRANYSNRTGTVRQVACNPNDANLVALVGEGLIRILACSDYVWRQFGYCKGESWDLMCATWISQDRFLAGSADGKILLLQNGELKAIFEVNELTEINMKVKEEKRKPSLQQSSQTSLKVTVQSNREITEASKVHSMISFPRGLAFAYKRDEVHLYEMETHHKYTKRNVFKIPDRGIVRERERDEPDEKPVTINCIAVNPAQDKFIVTCNENQIYTAKMWIQDFQEKKDFYYLTDYALKVHNGPIGDMAVCSWKPILLTVGSMDRTLKIWNYETQELELSQQFQDDLYGISIHPSGHYAIVGFSDKLRFLTITIDEFVSTREFQIRTCSKCSFSKLGHYFAAANGNIIQVYSSISFEMVYILKGHNGIITGLSWSRDDKKLSSCGTEGTVYEWIVMESKRVSETIIKSCVFTGVAVTSDGKSTYSISNDGRIRELINSNVRGDILVISSGLDAVCLSQIDQMLFVSGNEGTVYNMKLPVLEKTEYLDFTMHSDTVNRILISYDDRYLLTGSKDGSICVWKLLNTELKAIKLHKDFTPSQDILIGRTILEEKNMEIRHLQLRLHELETEHAYQLRQNDVIHNLKMKDVHSGYCSAIEELKEKNEAMETDHLQEVHNINMDITKMKSEHDEFVRELEANYNEKLIFEYDKYARLQDKMEKMRCDYEKELDELREAKKNSEESLVEDYTEKLQEKDMKYEELTEELNQLTKTHETIKQQIEEDADREIFDLRAAQAKQLKEERDLNVKIRAEAAMVKKKLSETQKITDDLKQTITSLNNEHVKFKAIIVGLEKDISDLKKEISERGATILDKEKRILELKLKNQELEKFKFILNFKIDELKSQIEPRERTIQEQIEQINEMVKELENLQRINLNQDLKLNELKEKLKGSEAETKHEIERNAVMKKALKKIRNDIYEASGQIQDTIMLKKAIKAMYHKYNADEDFALTQAENIESKGEFLRQREFLERTVSTLQKQVLKKSSTFGTDKIKLVEENTQLLVETNTLRKTLKIEHNQKQKLQSILGVTGKFVLPKVAEEKMMRATATRDEIHEQYRKKIEENERCIAAMTEENNRLLSKIITEEENYDENMMYEEQ